MLKKAKVKNPVLYFIEGTSLHVRGGSFFEDIVYCRTNTREYGCCDIRIDNRGFRVCLKKLK
jgi:hypothetical protein